MREGRRREPHDEIRLWKNRAVGAKAKRKTVN